MNEQQLIGNMNMRNARALAREMSLRTAIETMRNIEFALRHDAVMATEAVRVRKLLLRFQREGRA